MSQNQISDSADMVKEITDLEVKIQERKDFLDRMRECVIDVTRRIGKTTTANATVYSIHTVRKFAEFGPFAFYCSTGETQFGGSTIKISCRCIVILHFTYRSLLNLKYKVLIFPDPDLQDKIDKAIAGKEAFIERYLHAEEDKKHKIIQRSVVKAQLAQLRVEASRLGFFPDENQ